MEKLVVLLDEEGRASGAFSKLAAHEPVMRRSDRFAVGCPSEGHG